MYTCSVSDQQHHYHEIQLEYWGGKKDSQKVRITYLYMYMYIITSQEVILLKFYVLFLSFMLKSSVKVRSLKVTVIDGPLLSITAIIRKKGGIRIRRSKDSTGESSIMSVTASHLSCRSSKNEVINGWSSYSFLYIYSSFLFLAVIDGVEWNSLTNIKLSAQWSHTSLGLFPRATCQTPPISNK